MFDFVTSDQHFGHKKINLYAERPFGSVEEMNDTLIAEWNAVVKPDDTVLCEGDLALGVLEDSLKLTERLNGHRFLIPGNHDRVSNAHRGGKDIEKFRSQYEDAGWTILPEIVHTSIGGHDVVLSHYPYVGDSHGADRHGRLRPIDEGLPLIHGHVHQEWAVRGRQFNSGVDVHDFAPVPVSDIITWLDAL